MRFVLFAYLIIYSISSQAQSIVTGAEQVDKYLPMLQAKRVGIVCNHSSRIGNTLLVDSLLKLHVNIVKIFAPEHGFRGEAEAGEYVASGKDLQTGLPIISLYGKNKKPSTQDLSDVNVLLFDIQDVGVRFYTYISTLHYVMESAAENNKPLIVLDRPNPLGYYVDGPVLDTAYRSFVGMHPVPIVHGMTIGEYAQMINGEKWLKNNVQCSLTVIPCSLYRHNTRYVLPVKPSPNLIDMTSVYLYPSLCLFEGTVISVGRGTAYPFQVCGHPLLKGKYSFSFTPKAKLGNKTLLYDAKPCYGLDLRQHIDSTFTLKYLLEMYHHYPYKKEFFNSFFIKLIGNKKVYDAIKAEKSEVEIRSLWTDEVNAFMQIRKKYLLYD